MRHSFPTIYPPLQTSPPSSLNRQQNHRHKRRKHKRARSINRRLGIRTATINSNDGSQQAANPIQTASNARASSTVRCGKDFWCVCEQHAIHDVLEESFETGASELDVWICGDGEAEECYGSEGGRDCHGALTADVRDVNRVAGEDGAWDAHDGGYGVVAVDCFFFLG